MVKKLVILVVTGMLFSSGWTAAAQELLSPDDFPTPSVVLPDEPMVGSGTREIPIDNSAGVSTSSEPISAGDLQPALEPYPLDDSRAYDCAPALLESTGTWLRRGFWYSEVDVLVMDRIRERDDSSLAFQLNAAGNALVGAGNVLFLEGGRQGAEATPRVKLGRFLFRDHKNRDHAAEFIFYGGGQWTKDGRLDAVNGGTLTVSSLIGSGFNGATSMQYDYDSRFNSFELNYHVKSRMRKDRMEMEPSGHWVRRAQPSISRSLMAGLRYFDLNEDFDWDAFGIDDDNNAATAPQSGNYRVRTDNDLIGTQLGFSWTYETARWSLGLQNKAGVYLNHTDVESSFEVTGGVTSGDNEISVDNLSFINEGALLGKWHLKPNLSLRAGMEILYVSSLAHAAEQLNFVPVSTSQVVGSGDSTFMGALIGFEGYW